MALLNGLPTRKPGSLLGRERRDQTATTKLTLAEIGQIQQAATADGKTVGEWLRELALAAVRARKDGQDRSQQSLSRETIELLVTEAVAGRMLIVNLLPPILNRHKLTAERVAEVMAVVRREKHKAARDVLSNTLPFRRRNSG